MGCIVVGAISALVLSRAATGVLTLLLAVGLYFMTTPQACWWSPGSSGC